jgi:hypothetical protein
MGLALASLVSVVTIAATPVRFSRQSSEEGSEERPEERSQASNRMDEAIDQARDARDGPAGLAPRRPQDSQTRPASRLALDQAQDTMPDNS